MTKINLIGPTVNVSRVYEIAKTGNHTVKLIAAEGTSNYDIELINEFYGFNTANGFNNIYCEVFIDAGDVIKLINGHKFETLGDIEQRITQANKNPEPSRNLSPACQTLLKTAIEKLNLGLRDTLSVIEVALTITRMDGSSDIKPQHIAEAIHYQAIDRNQK